MSKPRFTGTATTATVTPQVPAWFWCKPTNALFVGVSGGNYPHSDEIEQLPTGKKATRETGDEVFMRQVHPWKAQTITPNLGVTIYYKQVQQPTN